jgi:hypothetical protein
MQKQAGTHSVLLQDAARRILRPLGLLQKGRSRTWLADEVWWMIVVEFQPSGFSKGSYLNIGCMWLWNVQPHISFDEGHRVERFFPFESEEQFRPIAEKLVKHAAEEVIRYRKLFPTIRSVSDYYIENAPHVGWPSFNAAIAHGLSGRIEAAARLLNCWGDEAETDPAWVKGARSDSMDLATIIADQERFQHLISTRVRKARELQRLPPITEVDFAMQH